MGQNQSTPSTQEPYHKRHYTATNRQIQRQNSISLTSPNLLLQNPGALKRQGTLSMQSSSTANLHSSSTITTATGRGSGVTGDNTGATEGEGPRPFIRLMPIDIPQPVYFDESSASEEDDYDYDDGGDGEYSDGYSEDFNDHPHSRYNSNHRRRTHRSNTREYSDDDTDLVEHQGNKRGLASSPSYLDTAALNGRTTSGTDAYGYEQSMSREQADYRRSKEEEDEDLSYLSPVSGTRRFAKPTYPRGGLHSEPFYPSHPHLTHDDDLTNNQNFTDDNTSDDEAYNEELLLKRYQLRDLPSVQTGGTSSGEVMDTVISQLDVSSSSSAKSPTTTSAITLDAIHEEKEDNDDNNTRILPSSLPILSSKTTTTGGERGGGPVSVSSSNNSLKESSRMGYSLHHAQPLQEANNQHSSSSAFSNFNNKGEKGERDGSCSFGAHNNISRSLPPLDSSSSSSSYQYHGQGQGQQEQDEQRRVRGERYDGSEVRTDLDLCLHQETAVHPRHEQSSSQRDPTATGSRNTATPSHPPALAPRPPKSSNDILVVPDNEEQEEHEEQGGRGRKKSTHSRQGSTTLRKEMLSNVSQRVGDLDSRVNQMDALVSYKLTDIESKVQVLHDEQATIATPDQPTPQEATTTSTSSDPLPSMSFAEGEQPLATTTVSPTNPLRASQLFSKASLLELRLELQAFGMRFHELNDSLLTDLMTQMRQAKLMLFESTSIAPIDPTGAVVRRVDRAEAEMHAKLLGEIETRIQERVLAMEVTSARLEKCFDQMEARLGALEIVLVAGAGTGTGIGTGTTGTTTVLKRPRPESMYKILQQQQAQLQREQHDRLHQKQRQQGSEFTHRSRGGSDSSSSPESPTPDKFPSTTTTTTTTTASSYTSSSSSNSISRPTRSSSFLTQNPLTGDPRTPRPTRILTTPVPHLLQQRTAPLSANPTSAIITRNHRSHTLGNHPGPINLVPNGHINGPISAHPLSSSLPLARHHLLTTQRSMTALMAGPINHIDPSSFGTHGVVDNSGAGAEGVKKGKASGQKVIRRPSSYKELLHFWKAGGSTPDLLNTGDS